MLDGAKAWVSAPAMYLLFQRTWREKRKEEEKEGLEWGGNKLSMHIVHKFDKLHSHTHTHMHLLVNLAKKMSSVKIIVTWFLRSRLVCHVLGLW
jgi:hypothetical protein